MSLNVVHLVGRVGSDPDVRYFESGSVKCRLTLAVNRPTKDDQPDWFNLEIWGKTAQVAADYVRKGALLGIKGSLKFDRWQDRNTGADRSSPVILVERMDILSSKRDTDPSAVPAGYVPEM
ncbi:single-stranded DNA-binding protein [Thermosynechococcus sichuanensis E542]|uniref:Single-stranded DNA-binding protein n=1 Tax=Thermosynechococcus sichuanensis E542 TaxID=2016101 RepID=A0A3B7MFN4_9CYAN|nr:single-stranded DNA-binding protein [Thermosynechococcus vestitus]AXY68438.1 single-stranded DNA-binding protein [Thermosynechococcus vestitus E542]